MARAARASLIVALLAVACTSDVDPPASPASTATTSPSAGATPAGTASPSASPAGATSRWTLTASYETTRADLYATYVTDVVAWNDRFVAIGRSDALSTGEDGHQRLWTSDDGRIWTEQDADFGTDELSLVGLAPLADGRLLAVGVITGDLRPGTSPFRAMAWVSDDAAAWEAVDLPLEDGAAIGSFADGPVGYAFTAHGTLWFSADGLDWSQTHAGVRSVHAGEEGFVAISDDGSGRPTVVASADGVTWLESERIGDGVIDVAPLGGDWLATSFDESTISVWWSANGLDWERVLDVNDLTGPDGPKAGLGMESGITGATLTGAADLAVLTLSWNHCCAQLPVGVGAWTSIDGRRWIPALEADAVVEAAAVGDATVLAGFVRRGEEAAFWVGD